MPTSIAPATIVRAAGPAQRLAAQVGAVALVLWAAFRFETGRRLIVELTPVAGQGLLIATLLAVVATALLRRAYRDAPMSTRLVHTLGSLSAAGGATAPVLAVLAFLLPALHSWTTAQPIWPGGGALVLGILPWSDAGDYYSGAEGLLIEGSLDPWNQRRPLNAALLAVRLALFDHDLRLALLLQAVLLGVSGYLLARTIARLLGGVAGLAAFAVLYAFGHRFVHLTLSEALGLTFGALALSLLLTGLVTCRKRDVLLGLGCLALALNARSGAFLVLPMLVLWCGVELRHGKRFDWTIAGLGGASILTAFVANGLLLELYGDGFSLGQGNFSFVLYGLAAGNLGWQQIYRDYPQLAATMDVRELNAGIYRVALAKIAGDPALFTRGLASRFLFFVTAFPRDLVAFLPLSSNRYADGVIYLLGCIAAMRRLGSTISHDILRLLAFVGIGFASSGAIVYGDTDLRVFAATFPFLALLFALVVSAWHPGRSDGRFSKSQLRFEANTSATLACTLAIAAIIGPGVAHSIEHARLMESPTCTANADALVIYAHPRMTRVEILSQEDPRPTFLPLIRDEDFVRVHPGFGSTSEGRLIGPTTIAIAYDLRVEHVPNRYVFVSGDTELLRPRGGPVYLCGVFEQQGWFRFFRATSLGHSPQ